MKHHERFWVIAVTASIAIILFGGLIAMFTISFEDFDEAAGYAYSASRCARYTEDFNRYQDKADRNPAYQEYADSFLILMEKYCD